MRTSNIIKTTILLLAICGAMLLAPHFAADAAAADLPKDAVVIGFIDSGISTANIDPSHVLPGRNFAFPDSDTTDRINHGTKTAGMVLGSADGAVKGLYSAAYAVPLVVVDKYPSGVTKDGGVDALTAAIYAAVDDFGCGIINISLSTVTGNGELEAAVEYAYGKGVIIVASVSNYANTDKIYYPAHYDHVISVGAANGDVIASFSQIRDADFFYQGSHLTVADARENVKTAIDSGTSFSCACVSGVVASYLAENPGMSFEEVKARLYLNSFVPASGFIRNSDTSARVSALISAPGR